MTGTDTLRTEGQDGVLLTSAVVHQWQCDHFGHLNVRNYAATFDDALFILWGRMGFRHGEGIAPVTAELRFTFHKETMAGSIVSVFFRILRIGTKSATIGFELREGNGGPVLAGCEAVEVFFDLKGKHTVPIPPLIRNALERPAFA